MWFLWFVFLYPSCLIWSDIWFSCTTCDHEHIYFKTRKGTEFFLKKNMLRFALPFYTILSFAFSLMQHPSWPGSLSLRQISSSRLPCTDRPWRPRWYRFFLLSPFLSFPTFISPTIILLDNKRNFLFSSGPESGCPLGLHGCSCVTCRVEMRRTGERLHRTLPHFPLANSGSKSIKNFLKCYDNKRQASKNTNFFLFLVGFMKLCPRQAQEFFSESWLASSQICPSSPPSSWDTKWAPTRNSRMCFCFFPSLLFFFGPWPLVCSHFSSFAFSGKAMLLVHISFFFRLELFGAKTFDLQHVAGRTKK